ncbi:LuxR family transcriptional regulator [Sphingobium sufflavum]|uniref:helix-turn-helix transcriptional regulator n=1 Tax=Sphingobium sufflavum TaxID=1129547 RepID=UPI001F1C0F47|nr:LuxR family transcriptional regulator [Sphingobium sufflavum]MCE7798658.1 LuxR family transcriptional regulator [Sphingobium sufflavum]
MALEIGEIFGRIERARNLSALWSLMLRHFTEAGFGAIAYIVFDRGRVGQVVALLERGFPPDIVHAYAEMGYGQHDPTLRVVMATGQPDTPSRVAERFNLSPEERQYKGLMRGLEAGDALSLPLYGPHGRDAYGILGQPADPEFFRTARRTELHMAAQAAHLKAFSLLRRRRPDDGHGLSPREVEILGWVAQGKSNSVIADILQLSPGTVDTYLRRIFEKLNVTDRTSAAVKGVGMGLIRV